MSFLKEAEWFTPLTALGLAAIVGACVWGWGQRMYWGDAGNFLTVIKENRVPISRCFNPDGERNPGFTCKVVPEKISSRKGTNTVESVRGSRTIKSLF